ncbi:hypothetical protein V2G26_008484 [Clonostachys chloroleuca]
MPAPGDQHQSWENPFEETRPRISAWTAKEIATISQKLDRQLGPEYISARAGPGGQRVHYLTAEKCISLANEVFGFNGWSSSIQQIQVDYADENPQSQKVNVGLSVTVRVTLRDGTYHEDVGYGSIENAKNKAMAFEKAKKEGTTDGLKRALRSFGNVLGNCIYDKEYVKQVIKVKAEPVRKFDQNNLHRHADFVKKEEVKEQKVSNVPPAPEALPNLPWSDSFEDLIGELDEADFCVPEDDPPEETTAPAPDPPVKHQPNPPRPMPPRPPQTPNQAQPRYITSAAGNGAADQAKRPNPVPQNRSFANEPAPAAPAGIPETVGFFSAKAVSQITDSNNPGENNAQLGAPRGQQMFNPKAESPSIRKTPGIDHTSSRPLARNGQHVAPTSSQAQSGNTSSFTPVRPSIPGSQGTRGNVIHPNLDQTRRIGAPSISASPLSNRNSFKQPTMKRPALADVPANAIPKVEPGTDGLDTKRQKMS